MCSFDVRSIFVFSGLSVLDDREQIVRLTRPPGQANFRHVHVVFLERMKCLHNGISLWTRYWKREGCNQINMENWEVNFWERARERVRCMMWSCELPGKFWSTKGNHVQLNTSLLNHETVAAFQHSPEVWCRPNADLADYSCTVFAPVMTPAQGSRSPDTRTHVLVITKFPWVPLPN